MEIKYRVRRWLSVALFIGLLGWAFEATTPEQCKVPVEQMSSYCKELIYP